MNTKRLLLRKTTAIDGVIAGLPASKSISNRAIMLDALSGGTAALENLSEARDTQLMLAGIRATGDVVDVQDAGTAMRFLTAYYAVSNQRKTITGSARMKERPIASLVDALSALGASVKYLEKEGFPSLAIREFSGQRADAIDVPGTISSQYISALMMIAPTLPSGLVLRVTGAMASLPYIMMTAELMKIFGAQVQIEMPEGIIRISPKPYVSTSLRMETDWSAASYWFAFVSLMPRGRIKLPHMKIDSLQGDRVIVEIMSRLGVKTSVSNQDIYLTKIGNAAEIDCDFAHCPDLAQTVIPLCAAKGIEGNFTGMESLRIKETDRILALQQELSKIDATLSETSLGHWRLTPGKIKTDIAISTYRDHRMAMGFAPWVAQANVTIEDPDVVCKSYPRFWKDVQSIGIVTEIL